MRLSHYSKGDILAPRPVEQTNRRSDKPEGLWVSVDGEDDWPSWCQSEEYGLDRLTHRFRVELADDANILTLDSIERIEWLSLTFAREKAYPGLPIYDVSAIDWKQVADRWQGIIIAPYQWERRLDVGWYYTWDCASGCIWDASAIASVALVDNHARAAA